MAASASPVHPITPPPDTQPSSTQPVTQSSTISSQARVKALLSEPLSSLTDDGSSPRPRDHRLIHLLLAAHGIQAYQQRVPLQLMDFAYRYTHSILSDALHIQQEGHDSSESNAQAAARKKRAAQTGNEEGDISLAALRMSIQSRLANGFGDGPGSLSKEFLRSMADERNRIALGPIVRETDEGADAKVGPLIGGVRLPHERHCLTGIAWGLRDEWESEGEESADELGDVPMDQPGANGVDEDQEGEIDDDDEGAGRMEDVFGDEPGGDGNDTEMQL